jgi:DNA-binding winged helix-turn-helix (wHTH) protein
MAQLATIGSSNMRMRFEPRASAGVDPAERSRPMRLRFGSFELDPKSGELSGGHKVVVLQWQALQLLLMLIDRPGEMVARDEIRKRIWGDDVIVDFDHGINQLARKLRRVLGDSAGAPNYIETLARRGYRLKVPVEVLAKPAAEQPGTDEVFSVRKLPAHGSGHNAEAGASGGGFAIQLREFAVAAERAAAVGPVRCRVRSPRGNDEYHDRLTPVVRTLSAQMLRQCLSAASPAETLNALRQVLILMAQVLEGAAG